MLAKATNVIGLKVIAIDSGKEVASVRDIIYSPTQKKVLALLVDEGGWFSDAEVITMESVSSIGDDAVMIASESVLKQANDVEGDLYNIRNNEEHLTRVEVMTEDGDSLGKATDVYFDPSTGAVDELEVSQGLVENIKSGKKRVKVDDIITVGEDSLIVSTFAEDEVDMQAQKQGLMGAINKGKRSASNAYEKAKDQSEKAYSEVKEQGGKAMDDLKEKSEDVKDDPRVQQNLIKARLKAKAAGEELKGGAFGMQSSVESGELQDKTREQAEKAKGFVEEKWNEAKAEVTEKRKESAVGNYITTNVLSLNDEMIARRGEMVTHDLIEEAESAGVLDKVLNNTSKEPVR